MVNSMPDKAVAASLERAQKLGTVNVLMVEDDLSQQMTLNALFHNANAKNEGAITFAVTSPCPQSMQPAVTAVR